MKAPITVLILVVTVCSSFAQINRYWNQNFSGDATMLGGALVGTDGGINSIYYNPAGLAKVQNSKFSINASLASMSNHKVLNGVGDGLDLNSTSFGLEPRFLSYMIYTRNPRWTIEIATLTVSRESFSLRYSEQEEIDILQNIDGQEVYSNSFDYQLRYSNYSAGMGTSFQINDELSIGASLFFPFKELKYIQRIDVDVFPTGDTITSGGNIIPFYLASSTGEEAFNTYEFRMLGKFGILYYADRWSVGMNITTPSLELYSSGRVLRSVSYHNINTGMGLEDFIIADRQSSLSSNIKDPLSVSLGFGVRDRADKMSLSVQVEYFMPIQPYRLIETEVRPTITTEDVFNELENKEFLTYTFATNHVVNAGFGYRHNLTEQAQLLIGFRTDFNNQRNLDYGDFETFNRMDLTEYNVYHMSIGTKFNIRHSHLVLGVQYSVGGNRDNDAFANFADPEEFVGRSSTFTGSDTG